MYVICASPQQDYIIVIGDNCIDIYIQDNDCKHYKICVTISKLDHITIQLPGFSSLNPHTMQVKMTKLFVSA